VRAAGANYSIFVFFSSTAPALPLLRMIPPCPTSRLARAAFLACRRNHNAAYGRIPSERSPEAACVVLSGNASASRRITPSQIQRRSPPASSSERSPYDSPARSAARLSPVPDHNGKSTPEWSCLQRSCEPRVDLMSSGRRSHRSGRTRGLGPLHRWWWPGSRRVRSGIERGILSRLT